MGAGGSCCHGVHEDEANVTKIDLSHCGLDEVPPVVFQSERYVETLNLSQNRILKLPPQLFHCQELKHLKLIDNGLDAIPPAIGSLPHLVSLRLDKNCIRDLPENIKMCRKLRRLSLSNNQLQQIPNILTQLISLEELCLNDCDLTFLPASVGRLTKLKVLELRNNRLSNLPLSMNRMTCLSRLDLGDNSIEVQPECIANLCSLQELLLDNNDLETFSGLGLRKLEHLDVSYNNLRTIGKDVGQCTSIMVLNLGWNYLETLPETMSSLTQLETMIIEMNELTTLPRCLGKMSHLEEINVSNNRLCDLPSSIGLLRQLKVINFSSNYVQELPCEIGSCQRLSIINASYNRLQSLPAELGYLSNLKVLDLVGNFLMYLPISMSNLTGVRAIWLSANQNVPLIPFTEDVSMASGERFLTNIALPQLGESAQTPVDNTQPVVEKSWRRKIRFEEDDDVQPGRLDRTPTPFPKELRQPTRKPAIRTDSNYVNVVDGRVAVFQQAQQEHTANGYSDSNVAVIREANIRKNGQPLQKSQTSDEGQNESISNIRADKTLNGERERKKSVKFSDDESEDGETAEADTREDGYGAERVMTTIREEGEHREDDSSEIRQPEDENRENEEENARNECTAEHDAQDTTDSEPKKNVIYSNVPSDGTDHQAGYYAPIKINPTKCPGIEQNVPSESNRVTPSPDLPPYPVDNSSDDVFTQMAPSASHIESENTIELPGQMNGNRREGESERHEIHAPGIKSEAEQIFSRAGLPDPCESHYGTRSNGPKNEFPYGKRPVVPGEVESPYGTKTGAGLNGMRPRLAQAESPYGSNTALRESPYGTRTGVMPNESPYGRPGATMLSESHSNRTEVPKNISPYGIRPGMLGGGESPYGARPQLVFPYGESSYSSVAAHQLIESDQFVARPGVQGVRPTMPNQNESPYGSRPGVQDLRLRFPDVTSVRESPYGAARPDIMQRQSPYGTVRPDLRQSPYGTIRQQEINYVRTPRDGEDRLYGTMQPRQPQSLDRSYVNRHEFSKGMNHSFDNDLVGQALSPYHVDDRHRIMRQSHSMEGEGVMIGHLPYENRSDLRQQALLNQSSNSLESTDFGSVKNEFQRQGSFTRCYEQGIIRQSPHPYENFSRGSPFEEGRAEYDRQVAQSPHFYENSRGGFQPILRPNLENGNIRQPSPYGNIRDVPRHIIENKPGFRPSFNRQSPYGTIRQSPQPENNNGPSRPPSENGNCPEMERPASKQEMLSIAEHNRSHNIAPPCYEIAKMYSTKAALFEQSQKEQT